METNEKESMRLEPLVRRINELEHDFEKFSDAELRAKTGEFRSRVTKAMTGIQQRLMEAQQQLEDVKEQLARASLELEKEEASAQCMQALDIINQIDKERPKIEREVLDELLPEAFAAVREAAKRTIGQRHFDVQLMGGITLHQGKIAEMKNGEGTALVATLPLYLNALLGKGVHLATVNDYLARRDSYCMGSIYDALGVSVASIYPMQTPDEPARIYDPSYDSSDARWRHFRPIYRQEAYKADITYGNSTEFAFDYLRDNMVTDLSYCVQRPLYYAIVDEVDNLLIDEACTTLTISAPDAESGEMHQIFARLVPHLRLEEDYTIDEKERSVSLTDKGITNIERMLKGEGLLKSLNLFDLVNYSLTRYLYSALKAQVLYKRDRDYVVKDGQVIIVDEFTGRLIYGRRYSEGLHQAIEAKEHVRAQQERMPLAIITIQNYFRMYEKLAGMTGTAATEAEEFYKIYKLEITVIPTHKPMIREDFPTQIYKTEEAKFRAVVREIKHLNQEGRPVLVGTISIEKSEYLSDLLKKQGIPCQVLNAKQHEKEAGIIARAGEPGAVTVATNMGGRGVDITLGVSPGGNVDQSWQEKHNRVIERGGLHIIGTEYHETRRVDNQLRCAAGRQGEPGSSRFYISLEDAIVRRFGGERIKELMPPTGIDEDSPIENPLVSKSIQSFQVRAEGYHFLMRKNLAEYDDVVNRHRELIYEERRKILRGTNLKANILSMVESEISGIIAAHIGNRIKDKWDTAGLVTDVENVMPLPRDLKAYTIARMNPQQLRDRLITLAGDLYEEKENEIGPQDMRLLERLVMLRVMDSLWAEHLVVMENIREMQANWQTLQQVSTLDTYKRAAYQQFATLQATIQHDVAHTIFHISSSALQRLTMTSLGVAVASASAISWARPVQLQILRFL